MPLNEKIFIAGIIWALVQLMGCMCCVLIKDTQKRLVMLDRTLTSMIITLVLSFAALVIGAGR